MTTTMERPVSVAELKRAWRALQTGDVQHQQPYAGQLGPKDTWRPPVGRVIPVLGCGGGVGASTAALALAEATDGRCRLIDCAPPEASGLAGASIAELGEIASAWRSGTREHVLIERTTVSALTPSDVPAPQDSDRVHEASIVDVAWPVEAVLARPCWLRELIAGAEAIVLATTATVPGLRRLENTLALLADQGDVSQAVSAIVGPRTSRWPKPVRHCLGTRTRALEATGRVVAMPYDRSLAISGPDTSPLPTPLIAAARSVLELLPATSP